MKKEHLPKKNCATCGREFAWRKKWARDWEQVKHCSDRCRMSKARRERPRPEKSVGSSSGH